MTGNAEKMTKIRGLNGWLLISCVNLLTFFTSSKKKEKSIYIGYRINKKNKKRTNL